MLYYHSMGYYDKIDMLLKWLNRKLSQKSFVLLRLNIFKNDESTLEELSLTLKDINVDLQNIASLFQDAFNEIIHFTDYNSINKIIKEIVEKFLECNIYFHQAKAAGIFDKEDIDIFSFAKEERVVVRNLYELVFLIDNYNKSYTNSLKYPIKDVRKVWRECIHEDKKTQAKIDKFLKSKSRKNEKNVDKSK